MIVSIIKNPHQYNKETKTCYCNCLSCGKIVTPNHWMHKKRFLNHYHFIYVEEGTLFLKSGKQEISLEEKESLILPPYTTICGARESVGPVCFYWIDFSSDAPAHFGISQGKTTLKREKSCINLLEEMLAASKNDAADFILDAWLLLLLQEIKQSNQRTTPQQMLVTQTFDYVASHITQPLTVESVADALQYNKNHLSRMISRLCGVSLKEYINREKITVAKRLLSTSNYSIQEIAEYLGYEDSNLFTKFFKYHANMSPGQYRQKHL